MNFVRLLDGFLILDACKQKAPNKVIFCKLPSRKIIDVAEEDLHYFENLIGIDLSENKVRLEQLKNLKALLEVNLSYN